MKIRFAKNHWLEKISDNKFIDYTTDMEMQISTIDKDNKIVLAIPTHIDVTNLSDDECMTEMIAYPIDILKELYG